MFKFEYLKEIYSLVGSNRGKLPKILVIFIIASLFDIVGIGLIGPYIALVISPDIDNKALIEIINILGISADQNSLLTTLGIVMVFIFLVKSILAVYINKIIIRYSLDVMGDVRSQLMSAYQTMPYKEYLSRNSSEYIYNIQSVTSQFSIQSLQALLYIISNSVVMIAILALLAWQDLAALTLFAFLLIIALLGYDIFFRNKVTAYGEKSNIAQTNLVQAVNEGIGGFKEIRILGKEESFLKKVITETKRYCKYSTYSQVITVIPRYLLEFVMVFFVVILVFYAIYLDQNLQQMFPTLAMFGIASLRLLPSVSSISGGIVNMRYSRNGTSIVFNDLKRYEKRRMNEKSKTRLLKHIPFHTFSLDSIDFRYMASHKKALNKVSLTINSGESIGLIGSSGSGKTTLVDMLLGLLEPECGDIFYNNKKVEDSWDEWRSKVAYLPQEVFLIDTTLRRNIALGIKESDIDDNKLDQAIKQSQLLDLVKQLPKGMETIIGERGMRLSGGQRQRIALARAFYHNREVLVMDESTSALDGETEKEIVSEMKRLHGVKTMIIIAHRLSTLRHCDKIYRLENGSLVKVGTYQETVKSVGKNE